MNRETICGFAENCRLSTLMAACLPMTGCTALKTAPKPPSPSLPSMRYSPTTSPAASSLSTYAKACSGTRPTPSCAHVLTVSGYFVMHVGQIAIGSPMVARIERDLAATKRLKAQLPSARRRDVHAGAWSCIHGRRAVHGWTRRGSSRRPDYPTASFGVATTTRFRPSRFASYMASSARRSSCSGVSRLSQVATPIDTVCLMRIVALSASKGSE